MPGYEDDGDLMPHHGKPSRAATTKMPWWNPRYWARKVWIAVVVVVIIIIVIGVAVDSGETFFDQFNYFNTYDPAHGFVHYVSPADAKTYASRLLTRYLHRHPADHFQNLTYATQSAAVIKVDTTVGPGSTPDASTGRFSVRIESKKTYNKGLFLFDVKHSPYGCAAWPALWLSDPSHWPDHGEVDVLESVNGGAAGNLMTLHTAKGCSMGGRRKMSGKALDKSCYVEDNDNAGCGVRGGTDSFGPAFNQKQGGVMAVEWRDDGIRMWQFARDGIPADITGKKPTPDAWGTAAADFPNTHCDIGAKFTNNSIIANIDLCGDLVEASWNSSSCGGGATCKDYVATKPAEFANAYWEFGAFQVYQAS